MNRINSAGAGFLLGGVVLLSIGCDSKVPDSNFAVKTPSPAKGGDAGKPEPGSKSTPETPPAPKTDIDRSKVPAELQTDAYRYYGLSNTKPLDMEFTKMPEKSILTGATTARMTKVDKGSATFAVETTGSLHETQGDGTVTLKPDGVWEDTSDKLKVDRPMLALPTGVEKGKSWKVDSTFTLDSRTAHEKMNFKSEGFKPVTIDKQTHNALYVVGTGTLTGGSEGPVTIREWFVKDIGMVKMELVQTDKGKAPVTSTMIWKPTDSKAKS